MIFKNTLNFRHCVISKSGFELQENQSDKIFAFLKKILYSSKELKMLDRMWEIVFESLQKCKWLRKKETGLLDDV